MKKTAVIIILLLASYTVLGQTKSSKDSVKVGLVLSGGGAKGLAHIGALKVIEEAGVKIDYIGGTSMGAIIGALYASGYSANELDSIFKSVDVSLLIQDNLPRGAKTFYDKEDAERYALSLPFNNFKVSFPSAISSGQNIYNLLVKLLYHVKDTKDFNKLPIPFFCIATDVETGQEILLNKGYLPEAIMASGTFPSLFEPAEIDNKILIDGGVVNNYPIEKLKKLGANIVIGIDVQDGLADRDKLSSGTEVLLQINNYRTVNDMKSKAKLTDVLIKPSIEKYSVIDFDLGTEIIESGEIAAREKINDLKSIAKQRGIATKQKQCIKSYDSIAINRLIISGNEDYTRAYIKGKLRLDLNKKISFNKLQQGINNLAATNNFKTIRYTLDTRPSLDSEEDELVLLLKIKENKNKMFIKMGAHYDDIYKSAAIINLTKKNIFLQDDVGSFDLILGDNIRYKMQYYLDKGFYWSFGLNSTFNDYNYEIDYNIIKSNFVVPDTGINNININATNLTNQAYIQTVWNEEFAFSLGAEHRFLKYTSRTLQQDDTENNEDFRTIFEKSNYYSTFAKLKLDTYNDKYFPSKGVYFSGDLHFYMFSSDYNNNFKEFSIAQGTVGSAFPITNNLSLNIEAGGGFKLGNSNVRSLDFIMGGYGNNLGDGYVSFLGYDFISLTGNSYIKGLTRLDYEFTPKNHLLLAANFANIDDDIFRTAEWFKLPDYTGYGVGYGFESFLGPIQTIYSWSPEKNKGRLFFSIGYWF
ncbi:patatin-like phospholipase family protein [Cellulophaga omnivescoria]|uniref:patatin-like phospholipase family protein n=1 Tax=Cellulophaga omnivescoria TaxID=1888890 RepID=UPI000986E9E3|nr:patatin-like phospholipase family protein [Cellulophaga omnivescoria]WBU90431.1 patatin-like phospholipase family protein [Cellulophaga omnivescoria]WKB82550.1 patatin-like phospholipase family protein [Cellulophaga lytica]